MNDLPSIMKLTLLGLSALLPCLPLGCDGSSANPSGPSSALSGWVVAYDATGGDVELLTQEGTVLARSPNAVQADGSFRITVPTPTGSYQVLRVTKDGRVARAFVTGFYGQQNYAGPDTYVSPATEAAVIVCSLETPVEQEDYGAFLKSSSEGVFRQDDPNAFEFAFRDVMPELITEVSSYLAKARATEPSVDEVLNMVRAKSHVLPLSLPAGAETVEGVHKAVITSDNSDVIYMTYKPQGSVIGNTPVRLVRSSGTEGSFAWTSYDLDVGSSTLASLRVVLAGTLLGQPVPLSSLPAMLTKEFDTATGVVEITVSNAATLVDEDRSGIAPDVNNTTGTFGLYFNGSVEPSNVAAEFSLLCPGSKKTTVFDTVPVTAGTVVQSKSISLVAAENQDCLVQSALKSGKRTLFTLTDVIDKTRYQDSFPMIAARSMRQTRVATPANMDNNFPNSNDNDIEPVVSGNTYTHYILDLDRLMGKNIYPAWDQTSYGKAPRKDTGRIPLVLVHGWQSLMGTGYRSAARLSQWDASPVLYFHKFLSFYLATPELHDRYHVYLARWPGYKHLAFSAGLLTQMLKELPGSQPTTDLALGMTDPAKGLVFITHSTGGLITRSALEMYNLAATASSSHALLRGAVLLASPNHGTPAALNIAPNNQLKDVANQSSADLSWDSFDGVFSFKTLGLWTYDDLKDMASSRWVPTIQNVREYDINYLAKLALPTPRTFNPWLLWLNQGLAGRSDGIADKYVVYSGWTRALRESGNYVNNSAAMVVAATDLKTFGYFNDSVLPIASTLLAKSKTDTSFVLDTSAAIPTQASYPKSSMTFLESFPILTVGSAEDHPFHSRFRLFGDFDHLEMNAGALGGSNDDVIFSYLTAGEEIPGDAVTDFASETNRREYIRAALAASGVDPGPVTQTLNPLRYDPLFLMIKQDLLDLAR
jgi:hypothetical protein